MPSKYGRKHVAISTVTTVGYIYSEVLTQQTANLAERHTT